jgi:hypothetical protein
MPRHTALLQVRTQTTDADPQHNTRRCFSLAHTISFLCCVAYSPELCMDQPYDEKSDIWSVISASRHQRDRMSGARTDSSLLCRVQVARLSAVRDGDISATILGIESNRVGEVSTA